MEALQISDEELPAGLLQSVTGSIASSLQPVRPLPSDASLISLCMALFVAFSVLVAALFGFGGFQHLTPGERTLYYSVILICAVAFSVVTVQEIIPGAQRRIAPAFVVTGSLLVLALVSVFLFPSFALGHFVRLGIPCLRLGVACAAVSGALAVPLLRKGFLSSPAKAGATIGCFAGLTGVAVLAFHCPIKDSLHIVVWHLGAMAIGGLVGAALPFLRQLLPRSNNRQASA